MPPDNAETPHLRFPSRSAPDPETAQRRLALLTNWQTGAVATTIVVTALLPFAIAWRVSYPIAIAASIVLAAILSISTHVARRRRLATMALSPKLVQLPDLESERKRLQSARTRRALAAGLSLDEQRTPSSPPAAWTPAQSWSTASQQCARNCSNSPATSNKRKYPILRASLYYASS
jgi:hypothetical protein